MIPKRHIRCHCGGIFAYLVQPNLQNIIFRENLVLEQLFRPVGAYTVLCVHHAQKLKFASYTEVEEHQNTFQNIASSTFLKQNSGL